jgi:hypothetical protein
MSSPFRFFLGIGLPLAGVATLAADRPSDSAPVDAGVVAAATSAPHWLTGRDASLGGVLFPHFHFQSVYGSTTADELPEIGHHDPREDGWTIQGFEAGVSARFTDYFEAYGNIHVFYDNETEQWDHQFEEWFGKIKNLPGGFELRGGSYLNRFGFHNATHLHGWDFVDSSLVNGRFLGDDGLYTIGGEVSWKVPVPWASMLSVSVGVPPEAEEHHHEYDGVEPEFEAGGALFDDLFVVANWTNNFDYDDFHQFRAGASGVWGENKWGRTSQIYGAHFEYQWRQNGYESGGCYFRWRTEAMLRSFGALSGPLPGEENEDHADHAGEHDESPRSGSLDEFGLYSTIAYGFNNGFELGLRGEFVSGIARAGLDERYRASPAVTYYLNKQRTMYLRAQYNYDHSSDFGSEHSVWAQIGINWGSPEVR